MNQTQLRDLAGCIARAHSTLAPIAANGRRHDGRKLPGEAQAIARAIEAVREAGTLLDASETQARCPDPRTEESRQGDPAAFQGA